MAQVDESESPKRRAILNAATELFVARGYGAVSIDAVARAADVSKATLYAHFESKDQLFATIVQVACLENIMPVDEPPDNDTTDDEALRLIGGRILRFFLRERSLAIHRLVIAESIRFPELGRAFYDNGPVVVRERLASWLAGRPGLMVPEAETAAEQFLSLLRAGVHFRATLGLAPEPSEPAIDAVVAAAVRMFLLAYRT